MHNQAWDIYMEVSRGLTAADVLEVPAGASYRFRSHAVLMRGAMLTSPRLLDSSASDVQAGGEATCACVRKYLLAACLAHVVLAGTMLSQGLIAGQ